MKITKNSVVAIDYTLKDDQGQVLDSSEGQEPLHFIQGTGQIIPGLENALEGKAKGEELKVSIKPEEAYGELNNDLVQDVPKAQFGDIDPLEVGMQFEVETDAGPVIVAIDKVEDETVTVNGNHPLAGKTLHFEVKVDTVRDASKEELEHGHVHGKGGVDH
jgi:FKBP-type peptidyl-prolyl cis-trans isomerase SlyD